MTPNLLKHLNIATLMVLPMERKIACVGPVLRGGNLLKTTKIRYLNEKVEGAMTARILRKGYPLQPTDIIQNLKTGSKFLQCLMQSCKDF